MSQPETYPPDPHITRDLAPVIKRDATASTILLPIVPELLDRGGRLRVGVAATVLDIICGELAIREVLPRWIATSSLSLQVGDMPETGTLRARPRVVRKGKTSLVEEVDLDHVETGMPVGLGTVGFAILTGRTEFQTRAHWAEEPEAQSTFATANSGFREPLLDRLGVEFDAADAAVARLGLGSYVVNTLGAMQGGVVAMLIEAAGDHYAADRLGAVARVRSLEVHYLKLAKGGPVRADSRTIGTLGDGLLIRVELHDEGRDDALLTVATLVVERALA